MWIDTWLHMYITWTQTRLEIGASAPFFFYFFFIFYIYPIARGVIARYQPV